MKPSLQTSPDGTIKEVHEPGEIKSDNLSYLAFILLNDFWNHIKSQPQTSNENQDSEMKEDPRSSSSSKNSIPTLPSSSNLSPTILEKIPVELLEPLRSSENRRRLFLACSLLPIKELEIEEIKGNGVGKWKKVSEDVVLIGLKVRLSRFRRDFGTGEVV